MGLSSSPPHRDSFAPALAVTVSRAAVTAHLPRPKCLGKINPAALESKRLSRIGRDRAGVSQEQLALLLDAPLTSIKRSELDHERDTHSVKRLLDPRAPREWVREFVNVIDAVHRFQTMDAVDVVHATNSARLAAVVTATSTLVSVLATRMDSPACDALQEAQRAAKAVLAAVLEVDAFCGSEMRRRRPLR